MASCNKFRSSSGDYTVPVPDVMLKSMFVREKRLLGAGPSNPPDRVRNALSLPMMGHLHPETLQVTNIFQFWAWIFIEWEWSHLNGIVEF